MVKGGRRAGEQLTSCWRYAALSTFLGDMKIVGRGFEDSTDGVELDDLCGVEGGLYGVELGGLYSVVLGGLSPDIS